MAEKTMRGESALPVRSRIYRTLYDQKSFCSRQMLAEACSVSMPTLHQNLKELMDEGLIRYSGTGRSTGGRRAQGLDIEPEARVSLGAALAEDHLRLVAVDLRLRELAYRKLPFDAVKRLPDYETELPAIVDAFLSDAGLDRQRVLGLGLAVPGVLTPDASRILFAPTLGLRDVPIRMLTQGIPYPVHVENDGSVSGHAEGFFRGTRQNMAYLSLEDGVGGAVLMAGRPYPGDSARSGEFGHICVEPGGLRCRCGKQGCLEAYCSARRVEQSLGVDTETFFRGVEQHLPEYENLLYDMLRHLATAILSIRLTLDCDVVLGGFFSEYLSPYLPILRQYVLSGDPFDGDAGFVQLSTLRRHITPLGAALYFVREFVTSV